MIEGQSFTIVGQGIAGTCLAHELLYRGGDVRVFNSRSMHSASLRAAGVINPITGRRFVKTWLAEQLIPLAKSYYRRIEGLLGVDLIEERRILHALDSPYMEENWALRTGDERYEAFMGGIIEHPYPGLLKPEHFAVVRGGLQIDITTLIDRSRDLFKNSGAYIDQVFEPSNVDDNELIIFCEGEAIRRNNLFEPLENMYAKGEALVCDIPDLPAGDIIKNGIVIAPYRDGLFWVGATYVRDDSMPVPTQEGRETLAKGLENTLSCPYKIVDHLAGVRSTTVDRRPYVGRHPNHENVYLLNGLGAKGASLAPFCAQLLCDLLESGKRVPAEVNILRYWR